MAPRPSPDVTRITLGVLALGILTAGSVWVLRPFVFALVWATMIVIATWPVLLRLQAWLGGRRGPAVALLVLVLLAFLVVPLWLLVPRLVVEAERLEEFARSVRVHGLPPPPDWLGKLPLVGPSLVGTWTDATAHPASIAARALPYVNDGARWVASQMGGVAKAVVQFLLIVILCGVLYAQGETGALGVRRFLRRLAGERGENSARLAAQAVRAVALGIVVTALAQTLIAGIGLFSVSVPHAAALTAVVFVLCILQLGPLFALAPVVIWLYVSGSPGRGTVLLVFTIFAVGLDNVLRPILIKRGADLPLLLIIAGVLGGLLAFGVIGLFVGPVVLAVTWTLLGAWVSEQDQATSSS